MAFILSTALMQCVEVNNSSMKDVFYISEVIAIHGEGITVHTVGFWSYLVLSLYEIIVIMIILAYIVMVYR